MGYESFGKMSELKCWVLVGIYKLELEVFEERQGLKIFGFLMNFEGHG